MKKSIFILSILSIVVFTSLATKPEGEKIIICHVPPGNPENAHSIEISVAALQTHLNHGDSIGDCQTDTPVGFVPITHDL